MTQNCASCFSDVCSGRIVECKLGNVFFWRPMSTAPRVAILLKIDGLVTEGIRCADGRWCVHGAYLPESDFRAWLPHPEIPAFFPWEQPGVQPEKSKADVVDVIQDFCCAMHERGGQVEAILLDNLAWRILLSSVRDCLAVMGEKKTPGGAEYMDVVELRMSTYVGPVTVREAAPSAR